MKNIFKKVLFWFSITSLLLVGCSTHKGFSVFNDSLGIRYFKKKITPSIELDAFRFDKETIKNEIWEATFYLHKDDFSSFRYFSLGKYDIATSGNSFTHYDIEEPRGIGCKGPRQPYCFGILLPEIDYTDESKQIIDITYPEDVVINLHFEDEIFNSVSLHSLCDRHIHLDVVISDSSAKDLCEIPKWETHGAYPFKDPDFFQPKDVMASLHFKIWFSQTYDYLSNNTDIKENWSIDHYDIAVQPTSFGIYYFEPWGKN